MAASAAVSRVSRRALVVIGVLRARVGLLDHAVRAVQVYIARQGSMLAASVTYFALWLRKRFSFGLVGRRACLRLPSPRGLARLGRMRARGLTHLCIALELSD